MKKYFLLTLLLIIPLAFLLFSQINGPIVGTINSTQKKDVLSASKTTKILNTDLFTSQFDSSLKIQNSNQKTNGPIYSQTLLISKEQTSDSQVGITVASLEGDLLETSPAKLRLLEKDEYSQTTVPFAPESSIVFVKNSQSNYELTVIWSNGKLYSTVVGSGSSANKSDIDNFVSDVVTKWQWQ